MSILIIILSSIPLFHLVYIIFSMIVMIITIIALVSRASVTCPTYTYIVIAGGAGACGGVLMGG